MAFGCDGWGMWNELPVGIPVTIFSVGGSDELPLNYADPNETPNDVRTGYYLGKNRVMMNMLDAVNYNQEDKQIYQGIDIEYIEGKVQDRLDLVQVTLDPFMCNGGKNGIWTGIDIRPTPGQKKWAVKAEGVIVKKNGYLVSMRGHLHDGGEDLYMKVNGKEVCHSKALYGGPAHTTVGPDGKIWETIREMTNCHYVTKVKKGDKVMVEATYDLEKHPS
jgi:hypothetical protein